MGWERAKYWFLYVTCTATALYLAMVGFGLTAWLVGSLLIGEAVKEGQSKFRQGNSQLFQGPPSKR